MMAQALFSARDVTKRFGGVVALRDFSLSVAEGSIVGLIGPNGSGKSTFFNVVTGFERPASARIEMAGRRIERSSPEGVANSGIARTFQNIRLFGSMSVFENVQVGQHRRGHASIFAMVLGSPSYRRLERDSIEQTWRLLDLFGIADVADEQAVDLPYGIQRRVEIARALAAGPRLLLLDEPTAGMNGVEAAETADLISNLRSELGISILLIEHNMNVVMSISDRIVVLNFGSQIAEGAPYQIRADPTVIEAYLGQEA